MGVSKCCGEKNGVVLNFAPGRLFLAQLCFLWGEKGRDEQAVPKLTRRWEYNCVYD